MSAPNPAASIRRSRLPLLAAIISIVTGTAVLAGWLLDIGSLRTFVAGQVSMKANTAASFIASGLLLLAARQPASLLTGAVRFLLAAALALIGGLTLGQDVFGLHLPVDQLLARAPADTVLTKAPGRMAFTTSISFILLASALAVDHWQNALARGISRTLATLVLIIALTSLMGYAYGAPKLYLGMEGVTAMSLPTAALFLCLGIGVIWLRNEFGFPAMMAERSVVGAHIRALIPMTIGAPLLVGLAVASGYGRAFDAPFAIALTSLGSIIAASLVGAVSIVILRRAEAELNIKDRALAASTNGVLISDHRLPDEPIIYANPAFTKITGYDVAAVVGANCRFLNRGTDNPHDVMEAMRTCIAHSKHGTFELVNRRQDGSLFWNRLSLAPVQDYEGHVTHYVGVMDDITDEREQSAKLQAALEEAEAANNMRNTFVRLVSHELRTPLNAALTWIRLMEVDDRPETLAKGISIVARSIDSQSRLVDDLVDVTRFAAAGVRLEASTVDALELVKSTLEELRPQIEAEQTLHVEAADADFTARLDPLRLQQIVRNLVTNASKYTPAGGTITVSVAVHDRRIILTVQDSGKGLTKEEIANVFEPFWRAESHQPGLGVGLSIVAALVAAHNGTIEVMSDGPDKGSQFVVRLPVDSSPEGHSPLHDESASAVVDTAD